MSETARPIAQTTAQSCFEVPRDFEHHEARPAPSGEGSGSTPLHESEQPSGSWGPETQKLLHRAKTMSDKNRKAQKRYRDKQRDKVEGYKRQVDELTQQVQQLLAEKAGHAPTAPAQQPMFSMEDPSSRSGGAACHSSCGTCTQESINLSDTASVCQAVVELVQELDSKLPEQHHLVADLLRIPSVTLEHASQTLINVWEVYVAEMARLLTRGAGETNSRFHAELIRLCEAVQAARLDALEKHPVLIAFLQVRLKNLQECTPLLDAVQLSVKQLSGVLQARRALQAGLRAIAEQRAQGAQAPLTLAADGSDSSEWSLAEHHLRHYSACRRSQALFREENRCFIAFQADVFRILGPVTVAKLYAVTSHLEFLNLSSSIEKALSCPPPVPPKQHALQQQLPGQLQQQLSGQQQPQLLGQLRAEGQPHHAGCTDDLPDFGSLSPARSNDLFRSLDFLQDPMLSPGLGV